jgi:hypothetical protein
VQRDWLPGVVFGLLVGWLLRSLATKFELPNGDVLVASVTLLVGWLIQRSLGRHAEMAKVPIESIGRVFEQLETLVNTCVSVPPGTKNNDAKLLQTLRLISNEIAWLESVVALLGIEREELDHLLNSYDDFKDALTGERLVSLGPAGEAGRRMRTRGMLLQLRICAHVLDEPADIALFASTRQNAAESPKRSARLWKKRRS